MKNQSTLIKACLGLVFLCFTLIPINAQRKMERMDRAIIAMPKSASQIFISWRHLAADPDDIAYNVYYKTTEAGTFTKLNAEPITNSTNYVANLNTTASDYFFVVKSVLKEVESEASEIFKLPKNTKYSRIVKDFDFEALPDGYPTMRMKFCWPADLNGDGKFDFVLDRLNYGEGADNAEGDGIAESYVSPKVEAYTSEGEFLWRIDMGYNVQISTGHSDMVTAFDMDGDGKAEVLLAVSEGTTFADGTVVTGANGQVTDYRSKLGPAPQWISIVNGETGIEIDRMELPLQSQFPKDRSDSWKHITGHFIIAYLDGIYPSLIYQYKNRAASGAFRGAHSAFSFKNNKLHLDWANMFYDEQIGSEFHQVRVADVDGDGYDELVEGGYVLDQDGTLLNKQGGKWLHHGDRHTLADIDPDRPGLEHFFIQQDNDWALGMGLCDAETGELIKGVYMSAVGDVGRGLCAALDPNLRGMQFWSTMNSYAIHDSKGKRISGANGSSPCEPLWWGGELSRYHVIGIGNNGYNLGIERYKPESGKMGRVETLYNEDNGNGGYYFQAHYVGRPAFWGDILGDWREEMVLERTNGTGFVVISTWDETDVRLYSLMQNPAYRGQTTARGYYQTADVDYYMAADMPLPPVPPVQTADLYYTGTGWIDYNNVSQSYADGKSIMFDVRGGNSTYTLYSTMSPSRLWLMNPKKKDYTFEGSGKFTGTMDVVKSMQGDVYLNGNHDYTGITRVSEGRLYVNGTLASKVRLDARGVIGGNATLSGGIVVETGLNVEGGRIEPGMPEIIGTLTVIGNLDLPGRNNLAFDIDQTQAGTKSDLLHIQGDFTLAASNHTIIINPVTKATPGIITLVTFTGTTNATVDDFKVKGLEGIPYILKVENNAITLEIKESRAAGTVVWKGNKNNTWDFHTMNFENAGEEDIFVPGDIITFNDNAINKSIILNETMSPGNLQINSDTDYSFNGDGVIGGSSQSTSIHKTGTGKLSILNEENTFMGGVTVENSVLEVASLKIGGLTSSIGASSSNADNWIMKNATLQTASQMSTDRNMTVEGKLTVDNPGSNSVLMSGNIVKFNKNEDISLELKGTGSLTLQGNNDFNEVVIEDGLLFLGSVNGNYNGLGNAYITLKGGKLSMFNSNDMSNTGPFTNDIYVPEGVNTAFYLPSRWKIENKLTGNGTIEVNAPSFRSDLLGDWSEFTGVINFTGREIRLNAEAMANLSKAEVNFGSGTSMYIASTGSGENSTIRTFRFGALSGSGALRGKHSYILGEKNINSVFSGVIEQGTGKLFKRGTASQTLSGKNLYTGGTVITEGTLIAANTAGSATGTGAVNVYEDATLKGSGIVAGNVIIKSGGNIMAGIDDTNMGTLTLNSNLTLEENARMVIKTKNTTSDKIVVEGDLVLNGTLELQNLGTEYKIGRVYTVFSAGNVSGEFKAIEPAIPAEGLIWDTSLLNQAGIIYVTFPSNLNNIALGASVEIFPTLVDDFCHISFGNALNNVKIELINQLGKVVYVQINSATSTLDINMSEYMSGLYFVRITGREFSMTSKIIKK